LQDSEVA